MQESQIILPERQMVRLVYSKEPSPEGAIALQGKLQEWISDNGVQKSVVSSGKGSWWMEALYYVGDQAAAEVVGALALGGLGLIYKQIRSRRVSHELQIVAPEDDEKSSSNTDREILTPEVVSGSAMMNLDDNPQFQLGLQQLRDASRDIEGITVNFALRNGERPRLAITNDYGNIHVAAVYYDPDEYPFVCYGAPDKVNSAMKTVMGGKR